MRFWVGRRETFRIIPPGMEVPLGVDALVLTLLFYAAFAIGEVACVALAINVVHGLGWRNRWHEKATMAAVAACGLISLEMTRRYWMVPVAEWPTLLKLFASICAFTGLVGLPLATLARWRRGRPSAVAPRDERRQLFDKAERETFIGEGPHSWMLRLPGNESLDLVARDWTVAFPHLPPELEDLSILHLTDLHFSRAYNKRYFEAVFDIAADMPADLVFVTGDLIDDSVCIDWVAPLLERLPGPLGRFAILGNHDFFHDTVRIADAATTAGFTVLDGQTATIEVRGRRVAVGGTCAPWGSPIDAGAIPPADFSLLLSHTPDLAYESAHQGWDFMLCGHNHGGQVRLPVIGPVLMPSRYSRRFEEGFYRIAPTLMYVSRGLGAKHPIRYGCAPEISRFKLVRSSVDHPSEPAAALVHEVVRAEV